MKFFDIQFSITSSLVLQLFFPNLPPGYITTIHRRISRLNLDTMKNEKLKFIQLKHSYLLSDFLRIQPILNGTL
jgi:hypothetical protein